MSAEISHKLLPECWKNLKCFCMLKNNLILRNFQVTAKCSLSGVFVFYSSPYICFSLYTFVLSNPSLIDIFLPHFPDMICYKLNVYHAPCTLTPCWSEAFSCSTGNLWACIISPNINQVFLLGNSMFCSLCCAGLNTQSTLNKEHIFLFHLLKFANSNLQPTPSRSLKVTYQMKAPFKQCIWTIPCFTVHMSLR